MTEISVVTVGGSIDKTYSTPESAFVVGPPSVGDLLVEAMVQFAYSVHPLLRKDSLEMTDADRSLLRDTVAGLSTTRVVVTHGTDTMVESARALRAVGEKTIVVTGAMQPAAFTHSDAAFNLGFACAVAQVLPAGVYVAMSGRVFDPERVRKNVAESRFEALD